MRPIAADGSGASPMPSRSAGCRTVSGMNCGGMGKAEVVVGEQRGTYRLDPRRHLVHGHRNAVLDFGQRVMQNVAGVVGDTHFGSPLLGLGLVRCATLGSCGALQPVRMAYLIREAGMADTTAAPTGGRALFVRQSSGLVREVSVRNALFYNTAA